jgi:hypothetical protein
MRTGFVGCFDGEAEPRCSETIQSAPYHASVGFPIDASNARRCAGAGEPLAWLGYCRNRARKLQRTSEEE